MRLFLLITFSFLFFRNIAQAQFNFLDTWQVFMFKSGEIAEIDNKEAQKIIGGKISLKNDLAIMLYDTCKNPMYRVKEVNTNEYLRHNYRANANTLGIQSNTVKILEIFCDKKTKDIADFDLVITNDSTLIFPSQGYFFVMKKNGL